MLEDQIVEKFLCGSQLRRVMAHLCNHCSNQVGDPIADTVAMMLTQPIHLVITEVGIALFKVVTFFSFCDASIIC